MGLLAPFLVAACVGSEPADPRADRAGMVDTLSSGRIVVTNPDRPLWASGEEWTLREVFRVGSLEGEHDAFGEIRDVELGEDGALYVLDGQADEIRVFGSDGAYVRTIGRQGEGPGELNAAAGLAWGPRGRLWVMSWRNNRYSAFDPATGEPAEERRRLASFASFPWPGAFAGGRLVDMGLSSEHRPVLLHLDTAFVPADTLPMPEPDEDSRVAFRHDGVLMMTMMDPFTAPPAWVPHPSGGIVVGEGTAYRLHRIAFDGDTTMTIAILREPVRVSGAERDSALAAFADRIADAREDGLVPDRDPRVPNTRPAHGGFFFDDRERIWVWRAPTPGSLPALDVIDADGRFLGIVTGVVPGTIPPPVVRNGRLAVPTLEAGVPAVVVYDFLDGPPRGEAPDRSGRR